MRNGAAVSDEFLHHFESFLNHVQLDWLRQCVLNEPAVLRDKAFRDRYCGDRNIFVETIRDIYGSSLWYVFTDGSVYKTCHKYRPDDYHLVGFSDATRRQDQAYLDGRCAVTKEQLDCLASEIDKRVEETMAAARPSE